ncbi:MAG: hypothetical protein A49_23770 [Methyloceanibacter sp.]|nr:MAG: hypothetical protein A49_23770 [Methyloceanibacter sp.]
MEIMQDDDRAWLGLRHSWGGETPFGLSPVDRRQHVFVVGKSGTGKTTLLRNLILQDIVAGRGVGVIDPHGDLAVDLLDHIPPGRTDDVVYFNPADQDYPIGLNLLGRVPNEIRHLVASGVVGAMKSIWRDSWGPRLEYLLYAAAAALLECENVSLLGVQRMFVDERYRAWVVKQVQDPVVRSFWFDEFAGYDRRFLVEAVAPIQNKIGRLLMAPPIRNILGQVRSKIDARFMMDDRRILIANLAKGRLGEDKANLLGAVLVTQFQLAAMSRADMPEDERVDFTLFVDEFHNFLTDSFASILSEARKYRLSLVLAGQYLSQVPDVIQESVFGNVGTMISFRVGEADAAVLAREFGLAGTARSFSDLANRAACCSGADRLSATEGRFFDQRRGFAGRIRRLWTWIS